MIRSAAGPTEEEKPGVAAFLISQAAVDADLTTMIVKSLDDNGFEALLMTNVTPPQGRSAAQLLSAADPQLAAAGETPGMIVIALDLLPIPPGERQRISEPDCDNLKILKALSAARTRVGKASAELEPNAALYSAKSSADAWALVRELFPEQELALRNQIEQMRRDFTTEGAIKDLSRHGRRAKVELIDFEGQLAIRKTFRSSALGYLEREVEVMQTLAPLRPEVPRLLARGRNYIIIEYVGDGAEPPRKRSNDRPRPLPLRHVRQLADFIKASVAVGIDPVDLRADGNVIYTRSGLYVIDFEFWRRCDPQTLPEKSYCLGGIPPGEAVDAPQAEQRARHPYPIGWYPFTLLPVKSFLYDPPWLQQLKRSIHGVGLYSRWAAGALLRGTLGN